MKTLKRLHKLNIMGSIHIIPYFFLLLSPALSFAQINVPQYSVGEYRNDVVFVGTYGSPGYCNFTDGLDFMLNAQQIVFPTGMTVAVVIDETTPAGINLTQGWGGPINVGDSIIITPTDYTIGIAALAQGTINFHITVSGTPTVAGEIYPCWIDQLMTLADCNNSWQLLVGESFIPCQVLPPQSIGESDAEQFISIENGHLKCIGTEATYISIYDLNGRMISTSFNLRNGSMINLNTLPIGNFVVRATTASSSYHKLIIKN
jgi:hypothetical protein